MIITIMMTTKILMVMKVMKVLMTLMILLIMKVEYKFTCLSHLPEIVVRMDVEFIDHT